jgi:DNA polymerase-3 subunit delta
LQQTCPTIPLLGTFNLSISLSRSDAQIQEAVADGSRYDVFNLVDAALSGRVERVLKIFSGLQHEGIAAPILLWALARETRNLIHIKRQLDAGQAQNTVFMRYQVWGERQKLVNHALAKLQQKNLMRGLLVAAQADRHTSSNNSNPRSFYLQAPTL